MPYSYAMYGYAGYAKHGYVTWLYPCDYVGYAKNLVTPHGYATWGYAGYVNFGYATWLCHMQGAQGVKNYEKKYLKKIVSLTF